MRATIFLDDGGVLNDNDRRAPEWRRLVGEYLNANFGGAATLWGEANRYAVTRYLENYTSQAPLVRGHALTALLHELDRFWLQDMFNAVGQPAPDDSTAYAIARALSAWVTPRVRAGINGAAETVHTLHRAGHRICLASAGDATSLSGYLEGMGIRHCIDRPYGVDLVGVPKTSPEFYQAIFTDAGVEPGEAIVIDDRVEPAAWARQAGAGLVLVVGQDITSLASLPHRLGLTNPVK